MTHTVPADSSTETITLLRENGQEPIFNVDEHKTLSEIMSEIDWSNYSSPPEEDSPLATTREPVWHLDADIEDQLHIPAKSNRPQTADEGLYSDEHKIFHYVLD